MGLHDSGPLAMKATRTRPHQLDLHRVRRRRAARPAVARREARGHPGRPAPRHHPARHVASSRARAGCATSSPSPAASPRTRPRSRACASSSSENYGERMININPESIYTGASGGGALRARARGRGGASSRKATRMIAYHAGIDIGSGAVKTVLFEVDGDRRRAGSPSAASACAERDPDGRSRPGYDERPRRSRLERRRRRLRRHHRRGRSVDFHTGHFYSHDHACARRHLSRCPRRARRSTSARCTAAPSAIDERGKVLATR